VPASPHLFDAMPSVGRKFLLVGSRPEPRARRADGRSRHALRQQATSRFATLGPQAVRQVIGPPVWASPSSAPSNRASSHRHEKAPLLRARRLRHPGEGGPGGAPTCATGGKADNGTDVDHWCSTRLPASTGAASPCHRARSWVAPAGRAQWMALGCLGLKRRAWRWTAGCRAIRF
jgi:hypothetical protein